MNNVDNGSAGSEPEKKPSRRKAAVAGVAGLVAVAGVTAGSILAARDSETQTGATVAAQHPAATPAAAPSRPVTPSAADSAPASAPAPTGSPAEPKPLSSAERIKKMKGAVATAYMNNMLIQGPPAPRYTGEPVPDELITEVKTGDIRKDRKELRVVSAPGDLTGQRALAWVADEGERVGDAYCTQNIKLSNNPKPKVRPNLLLCWRTSAKRSVYTLLVDLDGKPSRSESLAALKKEWAKLG